RSPRRAAERGVQVLPGAVSHTGVRAQPALDAAAGEAPAKPAGLLRGGRRTASGRGRWTAAAHAPRRLRAPAARLAWPITGLAHYGLAHHGLAHRFRRAIPSPAGTAAGICGGHNWLR